MGDINGSIIEGMLSANDIINHIQRRVGTKVTDIIGSKLKEIYNNNEFQQEFQSHIITYCNDKGVRINDNLIQDNVGPIYINDSELTDICTPPPSTESKNGGKNVTRRKKRKRLQEGGNEIVQIRLDDSQMDEMTQSVQSIFKWLLQQPQKTLDSLKTTIIETKEDLLKNDLFLKQILYLFKCALDQKLENAFNKKMPDIFVESLFSDSKFQKDVVQKVDKKIINSHTDKIENFKNVLNHKDKDRKGVKSLNDECKKTYERQKQKNKQPKNKQK